MSLHVLQSAKPKSFASCMAHRGGGGGRAADLQPHDSGHGASVSSHGVPVYLSAYAAVTKLYCLVAKAIRVK